MLNRLFPEEMHAQHSVLYASFAGLHVVAAFPHGVDREALTNSSNSITLLNMAYDKRIQEQPDAPALPTASTGQIRRLCATPVISLSGIASTDVL